MNIVPLHKEHDCENLAVTLRNIADDIEAGNYDFEPTIAVVVLGMESQRRDADGIAVRYQWQTHGLGEKAGFFVTRGLLASALQDFDGSS